MKHRMQRSRAKEKEEQTGSYAVASGEVWVDGFGAALELKEEGHTTSGSVLGGRARKMDGGWCLLALGRPIPCAQTSAIAAGGERKL